MKIKRYRFETYLLFEQSQHLGIRLICSSLDVGAGEPEVAGIVPVTSAAVKIWTEDGRLRVALGESIYVQPILTRRDRERTFRQRSVRTP
jgi:hypothetical protein